MADLKPVYLLHGDDNAKIDDWRVRVRRRAEAEHGPGGLESFSGTDSPGDIAASLATLSFATGTRYLLADDAGAWKAAALEPLVAALKEVPPDLVLVLIVRGKPIAALSKAVKAAAGEVREYLAPKPWELPKWVVARGAELGLELDVEAARTLVALSGVGQQRLSRELEKVAVAVHPEKRAGVEDIERLVAGDVTPKVYDLADAVAAGDPPLALSLLEELSEHDERAGKFVYPVIGRLREVHRVVGLLDSGVSEAELPKAMRVPPWRSKKAVAIARKTDRETLQRALCEMADLEVSLRNGSAPDEETAVTLALCTAAS
ncbi:MAG: DNA polymerase III subunit delta [Thermoleophilaceae bacterium]